MQVTYIRISFTPVLSDDYLSQPGIPALVRKRVPREICNNNYLTQTAITLIYIIIIICSLRLSQDSEVKQVVNSL